MSRENKVQLDKLLSCINDINTARSWKVAVEFRNKTWYHQNVYDLLNFHKSAIVIHDIPNSATPLLNHTTDFIYNRFHGPTGNYRNSYTNDLLNKYATYLNKWIEEGKTVYVYFNNTMGEAFNNLKTLNRLVRIKSFDIE